MKQSSGIYSLKMKLRVYRVKLQDLSPMIIFSRESGSITNMLKNLYLPVLQQRRKELRLTFSFKIVEDGVPAIRKNNYFEKSREKRNIKPKQYKDFETRNIVDKAIAMMRRKSPRSENIYLIENHCQANISK